MIAAWSLRGIYYFGLGRVDAAVAFRVIALVNENKPVLYSTMQLSG